MPVENHNAVFTRAIRLIAMDVDGVLTDGRIIYSASGEELKSFNVKDGLGITLIRRAGFKTAIITARISPVVERRAQELEIDAVYQGAKNKLEALQQLAIRFRLPLSVIAYIGDDLPDIPALEACGLPMCPADAAARVITSVVNKSGFVAGKNGGLGAVRDCMDYLLAQQPEGGLQKRTEVSDYACQPN